MAATALRIKGHETFITSIPSEKGVLLDLHITGKDFKPIPDIDPTPGYDERNEETYHRELRLHYHAKGEFISEFSTNPEWNPGYVEEKEGEDGIGENRGD